MIVKEKKKWTDVWCKFKREATTNEKRKREVIDDNLGKRKSKIVITAPCYCDYRSNISVGNNFYKNHNCTILDRGKVTIGENVFIAPNCVISTAGHAIDSQQRGIGLEIVRPITIGNNVWIGANVSTRTGVTIGHNPIKGAGRVENKNIPDGLES